MKYLPIIMPAKVGIYFTLLLFLITISFIESCEFEKGPKPVIVPSTCADSACVNDPTCISYCRDIRPILNANCTDRGCHNGPLTYHNGVHLDTYEGVSLRASSGLLKTVINRLPGETWMPQAPYPKMDSVSIVKIETWINQGYKNN